MRAFTRRRIIASVKLGVAAVPFSVAQQLLRGGELMPGSFLLGFASGFVVGMAEFFWLRTKFKSLGFLPHLLAKSVAIVGLLLLSFAVLNILDVIILGISWADYLAAITTPEMVRPLLEGLGTITFLLFFVQLDRLLGPGILLGYVTGRYHHPRPESRIFMFLDLKGSTQLADAMEADRYFEFLRTYFSEMSESILETNAEIYQYVGDEVVLTWKMRSGLEESSCLRVFFLIREHMRVHRARFVSEFGVAPDFKAGVHAGDVIIAQIGELKSEIVYNGDVLNTTARIQGKCNELDQQLLVSAELVAALEIGPEYTVESLGPIPLRGKEDAVELCAVSWDAARST